MKLIYIFIRVPYSEGFLALRDSTRVLAPVGVKAGGNTERWKTVWTLDEPGISRVDIGTTYGPSVPFRAQLSAEAKALDNLSCVHHTLQVPPQCSIARRIESHAVDAPWSDLGLNLGRYLSGVPRRVFRVFLKRNSPTLELFRVATNPRNYSGDKQCRFDKPAYCAHAIHSGGSLQPTP